MSQKNGQNFNENMNQEEWKTNTMEQPYTRADLEAEGPVGPTYGGDTPKSGAPKKIIIAAVIVVLAVAGLLIGKTVAGWYSGNSASSGSGNNEGLAALEPSNVNILSSDWDWDSKELDQLNNWYQVYAIMFVENNNSSPITKIEFNVTGKDGTLIENAKSPGEPMAAQGYIKAGQKGIMVADINTDKKNKSLQPSSSDYEITAVYANDEIDEEYEVPTGKIVKKYGANGDYYDVQLENPNDNQIEQDAILAAVKISDDDIVDSDATGRLARSIPGHTSMFKQEAAFVAPNLYTDFDELTIYVIDTTYYENAD